MKSRFHEAEHLRTAFQVSRVLLTNPAIGEQHVVFESCLPYSSHP